MEVNKPKLLTKIHFELSFGEDGKLASVTRNENCENPVSLVSNFAVDCPSCDSHFKMQFIFHENNEVNTINPVDICRVKLSNSSISCVEDVTDESLGLMFKEKLMVLKDPICGNPNSVMTEVTDKQDSVYKTKFEKKDLISLSLKDENVLNYC